MIALRRPAFVILASSLAVGISADTLLRASSAGINASLWLIMLIAAPVILSYVLDHPLIRGWKLVAAPGILCALGIAWRDSGQLFLFNLVGALGACALIAARTSGGRLRESTTFELGHGMLVHIVHSIAGTGFLIAREMLPPGHAGQTVKRPVAPVLRGFLVAVPFLLLFGSLFAAADARFEHLMGRLFDFDLSSLFFHVLITGSVAWPVAGFLRGSLAAEEVPAPTTLREAFFSLGIVEVGVFLGSINALFAPFVVLQVPYLFGGAATVASTAALTYAEYARRGFFELTAAACFTIVTLLLADWILRKETTRGVTVFRSLAGLNLLLLGVIMASAWQRLLLYQEAYGLTETRLYAAAALTGMGFVSIVFAFTVLVGRRNRFAFGSILAAYAVVLMLDIINPDALIARIDMLRASEGKQIDSLYLARLSRDATPELIAGLGRVPVRDGAFMAQELLRRHEPGGDDDWRTWNLSRARASAAIRENIVSLTTTSRANPHKQ
jgi:hypothetical protein